MADEIELEELSSRLGEVVIFDVRHPTEFDGTQGSACDPRQGHIPGAKNLAVEELMVMREDDLRETLGVEAGAEIVVYCHGGSRSEYAAQALRHFGYAARNYRGSWHEWSRTELPIES